jgi:hypothetical protein
MCFWGENKNFSDRFDFKLCALQVKHTPFLIHHVSNQQREPGKVSRPGKPLKNKIPLPASYSLYFLLGGGYLCFTGEYGSKSVMRIASFIAVRYKQWLNPTVIY